MNENNFRCSGTVYQVAKKLEGVEDEDWYEYTVTLWTMTDDGEQIVDRWDSRIETYNGIEGQRLTKEEAEEAVEEITDDVKNGEAEHWFNIY